MNTFNLSNLKGKIEVVLRQAKLFIFKRSRWFKAGLFLVFMGYCFYFVYSHLYYAQWSDERKREYINTKGKEVVFNRKEFESALSQMETRKKNYASENVHVPDIFRLDSPAKSSR